MSAQDAVKKSFPVSNVRRRIRAVLELPFILLAAWIFATGCNDKKPLIQAPPPPPPPPEIARTNLVTRDGHVYWVGTTNLFTGIALEFYKGGTNWSRIDYSNGLVNGTSSVWYPSGQMQVEEHFKNGVSDGLRRKWHENGKQMAETTIVDGQVEGTFRRWYDSGQLAEQIDMRHGKINGVGITWFPSGFLQSWSRFADGKETEKKTWKDGETKDPPAAVAVSP